MLCFIFDMSEKMLEDMSESMSKDMSERMSEDMSENMSEKMSENMSDRMSDRISEDVCYGSQGKCLWIMLHKTNNFATKDMSERISKVMPEDFFRKTVKRYVRKNFSQKE